jgi:hypothetical protein
MPVREAGGVRGARASGPRSHGLLRRIEVQHSLREEDASRLEIRDHPVHDGPGDPVVARVEPSHTRCVRRRTERGRVEEDLAVTSQPALRLPAPASFGFHELPLDREERCRGAESKRRARTDPLERLGKDHPVAPESEPARERRLPGGGRSLQRDQPSRPWGRHGAGTVAGKMTSVGGDVFVAVMVD